MVFRGIILGGFFTLSIYHFFVFLGRRKDLVNLTYAIYCVGIAGIIYANWINIEIDPAPENLHFFKIMFLFFAFITALSILAFVFLSCELLYNNKIISYSFLAFLIPGISFSLYVITQYHIFLQVYFVSLSLIAGGFVVYFFIVFFVQKKYRDWNKTIILLSFTETLVFFCIKGFINSLDLSIPFWAVTLGIVPAAFVFALVITNSFNREHKELIEYKTTLEQKVIERTTQLRREKEAKTQFFISLAHETKTPLTLISNYLDKYERTHHQTDLQIVSRNIKTLSRMMINFLDLNKLERGQVLYDHSQILDLSEAVQAKVLLFTELAIKKKIRLRQIIESKLYLKIDLSALDRILNNLFDNAVKFTPYNGWIEVKLWSKNNRALLLVKDNGPGIQPDQLNLIFRPFNQASKTSLQGIGMGLSLVKHIVEELGGSIAVNSQPQKGALFTVDLPLYQLKQEENPVKLETLSRPAYSVPVMQVQQSEIKEGRSNLLVVEDNNDLLASLQNELESEYNFYSAQNGHEALKLLQTIRPHLIISDIMMDCMDGLELIKNLPSDYRDIPFIFVTAKTTQQDKMTGLDLGAVDYLYKPFDIAELKAKIKALLDQGQARQKMLGQKLAHYLSSDNQFEGMLSGLTKTEPHVERLRQIVDKYRLTKREQEILVLLLKHETPSGLSEKLFISRFTAETHIRNIYKKLNINKKSQLFDLFDQN